MPQKTRGKAFALPRPRKLSRLGTEPFLQGWLDNATPAWLHFLRQGVGMCVCVFGCPSVLYCAGTLVSPLLLSAVCFTSGFPPWGLRELETKSGDKTKERTAFVYLEGAWIQTAGDIRLPKRDNLNLLTPLPWLFLRQSHKMVDSAYPVTNEIL